MISVVIATRNDEEALAVTLAALVPAAAEGFVREVVVADAGSADGTRLIADALGCTVVEGGREQGLRAARAEWVLVVRPGVRLEADWFLEAALFIERVRRAGPGLRAASFRHAVDDFGWRARLSELAVAMLSRFRASGNILAHRDALAAGRRLRMSWLRSRAFVGGLTRS
ncbi:glycosyltransferase [Labrys wisconsinensis]|uniref:Glycosyltransferase involved in cell wall biosynthesis n=1 Tax=Labrys wisconsinensis TaxID=425677 RepID=A0ABU0J8B0_9HYPH|nr:glycosyltransferase [Labrys wisconsinensis]MDQ0470512.1 glycosyltransferase involved in cell wall biosynthesis [Labrys wisconsinensis]